MMLVLLLFDLKEAKNALLMRGRSKRIFYTCPMDIKMCIAPVWCPWLIIMILLRNWVKSEIFESKFIHYSESLLSCLGQCFRLIYGYCHRRTFALHKAYGILLTELCFWNPCKGDFLFGPKYCFLILIFLYAEGRDLKLSISGSQAPGYLKLLCGKFVWKVLLI